MTHKTQCDYCLFFEYDDEYEEQSCSMNLDQDDIEKLTFSPQTTCPYFRMGNDYTIVKKQAF